MKKEDFQDSSIDIIEESLDENSAPKNEDIKPQPKNNTGKIIALAAACLAVALIAGIASYNIAGAGGSSSASKPVAKKAIESMTDAASKTTEDSPITKNVKKALPEKKKVKWNSEWEYAEYAKIHSDSATLYYSQADDRKDFVVCVNAGHGTSGGQSVKTQCHPDGTAKVSGGTTAAGSKYAVAVSSGTSLSGGVSEASANLKVAKAVKKKLLKAGFDVLMIRKDNDVQLDNVARTVMANNNADCHIAIHYDSTSSNKGAFYIGAANVSSYRKMEPVASHWKEHQELGEDIIEGFKDKDVKVYSSGVMNMDLTQISYSTIPSVDLEVGDRGSDLSDKTINKIADGIVAGVEKFAEK